MKHYGDIDGIGLDGLGGVNQLLNWGILPASLTQTQIDNLTVTPVGLAVFNVTDNKWVRWNGTDWVPFAEGEDVSYLNDLLDVTTGLPLTPTNADDGRVLYYDIDTNQWISDDIANISNVVKDCKTSVATGTIAKVVPVYQAGYDNDLIVVEPCDASDPNKMPCIGVTAEVLDDTNAKKVVSFGKIQGVDTSAWADGTQLYIAAGGGFTTTRPTGATTQIQRVATVLKGLDATGGSIKVFNTSRVAGLPNVSENHMWLGDANGHPIERNYIADIDGLQNQIDGLVPANQLISGFVEWSGVGFIYNVSALTYRIQGVIYTTAPTQITLDPSDPTNDRIDVIYADVNELVGKITGTPDPAPVKPNVDSLTQIEVTFITVAAGTTAPNITIELIYDENVEWTGTTNGPVVFNSTNDFYTGTVSTEVTVALAPNEEILYTAPAAYPIVSGSVLTFWMKFKANMTGGSSVVYIGFFSSGVLVGNTVAIGGTTALTYGLDASNTVDWQLASIPLTEFGSLPANVDAIKYFVPNLPGPPPPPAIQFFLDKIEIQEGLLTPAPTNWFPTGITLGDFVANGATAALSVGAGYYYTFDATSNDEIVINIGLERNGLSYDGSSIVLEVNNMLVGAGGVGDTVLWELDYAFVTNGDNAYTKVDGTVVNNVDVNGRASQILFTDFLPAISGPQNSKILQLTLRRRSQGPGADSFGGSVEIYGVQLLKQ